MIVLLYTQCMVRTVPVHMRPKARLSPGLCDVIAEFVLHIMQKDCDKFS